jgi:hypothetical protein
VRFNATSTEYKDEMTIKNQSYRSLVGQRSREGWIGGHEKAPWPVRATDCSRSTSKSDSAPIRMALGEFPDRAGGKAIILGSRVRCERTSKGWLSLKSWRLGLSTLV